MSHRVLIVDDEPYILRILSYKLRREGYITFEARSADEVEAVIAEHAVDLVLLDIALATPTTGFDIAARLRADDRFRTLPIIMLTARGFAADVLRGREVGADGYITKPFSTEDLLHRVRALLAPGE